MSTLRLPRQWSTSHDGSVCFGRPMLSRHGSERRPQTTRPVTRSGSANERVWMLVYTFFKVFLMCFFHISFFFLCQICCRLSVVSQCFICRLEAWKEEEDQLLRQTVPDSARQCQTVPDSASVVRINLYRINQLS